MKKYLLIPGHVESKRDGQLHYIGASELARLYGVSIHECIVFIPERSDKLRGYPKDLIRLSPDCHGRYNLTGGKK